MYRLIFQNMKMFYHYNLMISSNVSLTLTCEIKQEINNLYLGH
jgi:hypothetical protein